jgi:AraC-like DNA-binding protein
MSDIVLLNKHQKKALVIELYKQGKTRRQIAEAIHMSFKDIADIINDYTGENRQVNKPEKSKDARAFELFLQGKRSVEIVIELDMPADQVEELRVQYWSLSNLDDLETLYHEAEYSLSLLLQLHDILKEKRITEEKDIRELIDLANQGLPDIKNRFEELLNQVSVLENEKVALNAEIFRLRNSIYTNNEIVRKQHGRLQTIDRKRRALENMLRNASKDSNYHKVIEIVNERLNDKRLLLVTALIAVLQTLKVNPYGLNLLNSSPIDIEDYAANDTDGKSLSKFAESCYDLFLKSYAETIA